MTTHSSKLRSRGFTLIELAIVLGVVGVLAAGLFRLMSTGNSQTKDSTTAQQQQALIAAVAGFLTDSNTGGGQNILKALNANATTAIPLPTSNTSLANCQANINAAYATLCNYLPPGFTSATTNPYNQTYSIRALKDNSPAGTAPQTYTYVIATFGTAIPDVDGGRISSLIGGDGGFIYKSAVCTAGASTSVACGTMGAWQADIQAVYGFGASQSGSVVSRSFVSPTTNNSYFWLARLALPGDPTFVYNTMQTDMFMSGSTNINMNNGSLIFSGAAPNPAGSIQLNGGFITGNGSLSAPQITLNEDGVTNGNPLVQLTTLCSSVNPPACAGTTYALDVVQGDVYVGGAVTAIKLFSASDERLKTNIHPLTNALDNVMKIDPVGFTFKAGGSQSMGVTAQQLATVYPELVQESHGTKYVEYNGLIGPMLGAIQELKRQNDDLRTRLHQQELREQNLERSLNGNSVQTP